MAPADFPAFDITAVRDDPIAPQQKYLVRLGVEHVLFVLAHQSTLPGEVGFSQHSVVQVNFSYPLSVSEVDGGERMRQILSDIEQRIDDVLAITVDGYVEIATA